MPSITADSNNLSFFLKDGGEMGELIRAFDWTSTSIGAPEQWPHSLKTALSIILNSKFPMFIFWGPELICFYNDAYRPSLGKNGKHPIILGKPGKVAWPEIWDLINPMIKNVLAGGEAIWSEDQLVPIYRNGRIEDVYWTFSHSPINDDSKSPAGVLVTCTETTEKVGMVKVLKEKNDLLETALKELSESEIRFKTISESSEILIAVGDQTSNATYFNKAWTDLLGKPMKDLIAFGWVDLIHPEDQERYVNIYLDAYNVKLPFTGEFRILSKNGDYRWLLANGLPRFNSENLFVGYISSCIDITDRKVWERSLEQNSNHLQSINNELASTNQKLISVQKQLLKLSAEKQNAIDRLKANDQNLRNMVRQSPVGMCILQGEPLYVVEINDIFLELVGKSRKELKSKEFWETNVEAAEFYKPISDKVMHTGETYRANEHEILLTRNGIKEIAYVDFVYEPMKDHHQKTYAIMIVAIDVTDKVKDRQEVERAEEKLSLAIEAAELGSYQINVSDRIFMPSPRMKEFFGFSPDEEMSFETAINQIHPDYRQAVADHVEESITKGIRFDMQYPITGRNNGTVRWVRAVGTVLHDHHGVNKFF
ncbi:MAG: PAS domain S-box protein [Daejeonella sp.]